MRLSLLKSASVWTVLPLAIELAASRVRALSVEQISRRLEDRLRLLTGGARTALPRQQTLRATIDWSYDLLSEDREFSSEASLSFPVAGLWKRPSRFASRMEADGTHLSYSLNSLTNRLLICTNLREIHAIGCSKQLASMHSKNWSSSGKDQAAHNHHFAYFLQLAEAAENQLIGSDQAQWLKRLEREHDNFRTALEWCMREHKGEEALRMAGALGLFWLKHSHFSEGRSRIGNILEGHLGSSDQAKVKAWRWAGFMAFWQQDMMEARRIYTRKFGTRTDTWRSMGCSF